MRTVNEVSKFTENIDRTGGSVTMGPHMIFITTKEQLESFLPRI